VLVLTNNVSSGSGKMNISSSLEDYLEAIADIGKKNEKVRITDISRILSVEKSSVNSAVKKLKNLNLVTHERYEDIKLTKLGEKEAREIRKKHDILSRLLNDFLGLSKKEAEKDACRIEHVISNETFRRLSGFIDFISDSPGFDLEKWRKSFEKYLETGEKDEGIH
jgi:DtxR family Mn-dependent transcriptional regulator